MNFLKKVTRRSRTWRARKRPQYWSVKNFLITACFFLAGGRIASGLTGCRPRRSVFYNNFLIANSDINAVESKMEKRILLEIAIFLMLGLLWTPTFAWVHPDGSQDVLCECYGPRADKLLIHLYGDDTAEWAALKAGDIDITDWPLSKTAYEELKQMPYNETIQVANYGPEFGLFILDLNSNNNQYLGNPPDPAYPNPVADNNDAIGNQAIKDGDGAANNHNPMSSVYMRRAIAYLIDRPGLIADPAIGTDFGWPMYTTMPQAMRKYLLDVNGDPLMPWAWKYDPAAAAALLDANGFPINTATGYRFWDLNSDGVEQADEWVEIIFYIRSDRPGRNHIGTVLVAEMGGINLRVNAQFATSGACQIAVMINKDFHAYTGGWSLGVDPDHLILWSWDYYWHPGFCYNYGGHNDPDFNDAARKIMGAATEEEAVMYAMMAQEAQARQALGIPLYCASGNKAFYKTNTGGNPGDASEGEEWENSFVNKLGYGIDNSWTFMNMHTSDTSYGGGMVIDWGFKVPEIKMLNPVYASWLFDWNVLGQIYESLLVRSPSDLGELLPWIAKDYHIGTYTHATYGECTKVVFTLRDDVVWSDGTPLTVADVHFTFVELWEIISRRGLPHPWFRSPIVDFLIIDAFSFEVLLDVKSYWGVGWVGSNIILPKHIWKPIAETGDPQANMPDPTLTGSGPWKFVEYNKEVRYILLDSNPKFHRFLPLNTDASINPENRYIFTPEAGSPIIVTLENLCRRGCIDCLDVNIRIRHPNGTDEIHQYVNLTINQDEELSMTFPITWEYGMYRIYISSTMHASSDDQWYLYSCSRSRVYVTIKEDIVGSSYYDDVELPSYPYKGQLPTPDFKVDIKDLAIAAKAFGSYPSHERWDPRVDINDDYKVDIKDLATFARKFGFNCE